MNRALAEQCGKGSGERRVKFNVRIEKNVGRTSRQFVITQLKKLQSKFAIKQYEVRKVCKQSNLYGVTVVMYPVHAAPTVYNETDVNAAVSIVKTVRSVVDLTNLATADAPICIIFKKRAAQNVIAMVQQAFVRHIPSLILLSIDEYSLKFDFLRK